MKVVARILSAEHFWIADPITGTKWWKLQPKKPNSNPTEAHENIFWEADDEGFCQLVSVPLGICAQ